MLMLFLCERFRETWKIALLFRLWIFFLLSLSTRASCLHTCVWVYWKIISQVKSCSSFSVLFRNWLHPHNDPKKSFISTQLPLRQWWDCVRVEKRHRKDKTGKFVSANLDFGATRRFSIVICAPPSKGFSFIFLTVKKKEEKKQRKFLFAPILINNS